MFQESEVEGCEYQNDSCVHRQAFPEPVHEEQDIDRDDHGCHQNYIECGDHLASNFSPLLFSQSLAASILVNPLTVKPALIAVSS